MHILRNFNQDWLFAPAALPLDTPDEQFAVVTLPHTNKLFTRLSVDNADYQFVSTYRRRFTLPDDLDDQRVFVDFDGAMLVSTVYLNGGLIGDHKGGFTPFSFEITRFVPPDENLLTVYGDATEEGNVPPFGGLVDYLTFS